MSATYVKVHAADEEVVISLTASIPGKVQAFCEGAARALPMRAGTRMVMTRSSSRAVGLMLIWLASTRLARMAFTRNGAMNTARMFVTTSSMRARAVLPPACAMPTTQVRTMPVPGQ